MTILLLPNHCSQSNLSDIRYLAGIIRISRLWSISTCFLGCLDINWLLIRFLKADIYSMFSVRFLCIIKLCFLRSIHLVITSVLLHFRCLMTRAGMWRSTAALTSQGINHRNNMFQKLWTKVQIQSIHPCLALPCEFNHYFKAIPCIQILVFSHHWELKKKFMEHHKDRFPEDALESSSFAVSLPNWSHVSGWACSDIWQHGVHGSTIPTGEWIHEDRH